MSKEVVVDAEQRRRNRGLVIPNYERAPGHEVTPIHDAYHWLRRLLEDNDLTGSLPLVIEMPVDGKALWVWAQTDDTKKRTVGDSHGRGVAHVSSRKTYTVGIVEEGSFVPDPIFSVGKSRVNQTGAVNLYSLADDEASCSILYQGAWKTVRGRDLNTRFVDEDSEHGKIIASDKTLVEHGTRDLIEYIASLAD